MSWQLHDEFIKVRGAYIPCEKGKGTHEWSGESIVMKPEEKPGKKRGKKGGKAHE